MRPSRLRWIREAALLVGTYTAYTLMRNEVGSARVPYRVAADHARSILAVERWLFLDVEAGVQRALLAVEPLVRFASVYYRAAHQPAVVAMLVFLLARRSALYPRLRTALLVATVSALVGFVLFPLAPPRLLPELGFVDTVRVPIDAWQLPQSIVGRHFEHIASNQFAAMPSLHLAFSTWVALAAWFACGWRGRVLAGAHLTLTWFAVVVTANHWVLDGVAGAALVAWGWWVATRVHPLAALPQSGTGPRVVTQLAG